MNANVSFISLANRMLDNIFPTSPMRFSNTIMNTEMYASLEFISYQHFRLKGLLIGNGWTDPANQYPAYTTYAYERGLLKQGSEAAKPVEETLSRCRNAMKDGVHVSMDACEEVLNSILRNTRDEYGHGVDLANY